MTAADPAAFTGLPDLAVRTLGGSVVYANDELYAERENLITPAPAVFAPADVRPEGPGLRRLGDAAAPRAGPRPRDRPARRGRDHPRRGRRHLLLHRQLPARGVGGGHRRGGLPLPGRAGRRRLDHARAPLPGQGRHAQPVRGERRAPVHPRPAVHLPRRRGRAAAGARRGRPGPAFPRRHPRPGRGRERRHDHRLLGHVLLLGGQPDRPGPGPDDGRGLGERPPAGRRQRLGVRPARAARPDPLRRAGHVAVRGQRTRLGPPVRRRFRRRLPAPWRPDPAAGGGWLGRGRAAGPNCCRGPGCSRTPGTGSVWTPTRPWPRCGWTSTRTAGWPGSGCGARPTPPRTRPPPARWLDALPPGAGRRRAGRGGPAARPRGRHRRRLRPLGPAARRSPRRADPPDCG